jgi:hypothetical protein
MGLLKLGLAALVGFILGAFLFHTSTARANVGVRVTSVSMTDASVQTSIPSGSNIVGFSCVQEPHSPATCFVVSQ